MSKIDPVAAIPADVMVPMTDELHRLFRAGGCDPTCHGCGRELPVGAEFKLAAVTKAHLAYAKKKYLASWIFRSSEPHEIMLCAKCTPTSMIDEKARARTAPLKPYRAGEHAAWASGCSRIDGKIVP